MIAWHTSKIARSLQGKEADEKVRKIKVYKTFETQTCGGIDW